ncbi:hypothetical protein IU449_27030 [Nocardia higoensis]|uniref:Uncharacterized protein n=1 Tax=Nocardia higoensis TaxID=228599 RepID=A0ABS0DI74_9NOCA|nr:hypothetical protein [Nocardia higoensis]MBF6358155.1 hypothetical protein [Nocardia higoensis]
MRDVEALVKKARDLLPAEDQLPSMSSAISTALWMRDHLPAILDHFAAVTRERDEARVELQELHADTQEAFALIRVRQQRDAETIAKLRAGEAA